MTIPDQSPSPTDAERGVDLNGQMDARVWTREYLRIVAEKPSIATDEGTMLGWFANAIMAGWDARERRLEPELASLRQREAAPIGEGPLQTVTCHSCGNATHAEHLGNCSMCSKDERAWCCLCWDAEDTSCGADEGDLGFQG